MHPSGIWIFTAILVGIAVVWLVVLPRWSHRPEFSDQYQELRQRGIDPNAMFYTDHEGVWDRTQDVDQRIDENRQAFGLKE